MILESIFKLFLALVLGGIVGFERENKIRPAGFRTHILVSMGAALVQIISINYMTRQGISDMDPMRLGAQVISGIGFLGAGTILKEGATIKGLTTAASVWTVACIGLAAGSGLYIEATVATIFIFVALSTFKKFEKVMSKSKKNAELLITSKNTPGMVGAIGGALGSLSIQITEIGLELKSEEEVEICLTIAKPYEIENERILDKLMNIQGIRDVKFF